MSTNKNALIRYKVLDNCFRNPGRKYYITDLILACNKVLEEKYEGFAGISRRQIFDDISFMESEDGWRINLQRYKSGRKVYYRYADLKFSINNMPLNEMEIDQLESAIDIISEFRGVSQFKWVEEMIPKLRQGLSSDKKKENILDFDSNPYLKGIQYIAELHHAIYTKKVLIVLYHPYGQSAYEIVIHPYFLKQYNNRWFLFGYNPETGRYDWNIALDRIIEVKEAVEEYVNNNELDWNEYFEDIVGVTKPLGAEVEKVILNVFGKTCYYIESKPLHGSQKARWKNGETLEVELELIINYELEREILSYGEFIKVISPKTFSDKISNRSNRLNSLYQIDF